MKVKLSYYKPITETFNVPKEWEFFFKKNECDWTDEEWELSEWGDGICKSILNINKIDSYIDDSVEIEDYWD